MTRYYLHAPGYTANFHGGNHGDQLDLVSGDYARTLAARIRELETRAATLEGEAARLRRENTSLQRQLLNCRR